MLRHTLQMRIAGFAVISWPLVFRPLHNAFIEDAFNTAQYALKLALKVRRWSSWVKLLRFMLSGGKSKSQKWPDAC